MKKLDAVFNPKSIAVIAHSPQSDAVATDVYRNLLSSKFHGSVCLVNGSDTAVSGAPAYPTYEPFPDDVDLAVLVAHAGVLRDLVDQAIENRVKALAVVSPGFQQDGRKLHRGRTMLPINISDTGLHSLNRDLWVRGNVG